MLTSLLAKPGDRREPSTTTLSRDKGDVPCGFLEYSPVSFFCWAFAWGGALPLKSKSRLLILKTPLWLGRRSCCWHPGGRLLHSCRPLPPKGWHFLVTRHRTPTGSRCWLPASRRKQWTFRQALKRPR